MENKLDNFESFIKQSLDNHEAPYNAASWASVSKALDGAKKPFYKTKGFIAGAAAIIIASTIFLSTPKDEKSNPNNNNESPRDYITQNNSTHTPTDNNNNPINSSVDNNVVVNNDNDRDYLTQHDNLTEAISDDNKTNENNSLTNQEHNSSPNINPTQSETPRDYITEEHKNNEENSATEIKDDKERDYNTHTPTPVERDYLANFDVTQQICEGTEVALKADLGKDIKSISWMVNGKFISNDRDYLYKPTNGKKQIRLVAKNDNGKIVSTKTKTIQVNNVPNPTLATVNDDYSLINKQTFELNDDYKNVTWNFGDGAVSNETSIAHTYPKQGNYNLNCVVESANGCTATLSQKVTIDGYYNIRRDFGFSPDGDGSLDLFMPAELKMIDKPIEMTIYSATTKQIVYQTNSVDKPWDGIDIKTGSMAPFGAYVWIVTLKNELGHDEVYKGNLTKASK